MRPIALPLLAACVALSANAQTATPDIMGTAGGHGASSAAQVSWSIGEPVTETALGGSARLTQGFEQPRFNLTIGMVETAEAWAINAYPNPVNGLLTVELPDDLVDANAVLFDAAGKRTIEQRINTRRTTLDLSMLASGQYFLELHDRLKGKRALLTINKTN